jgi:hypothetical protein
MSPDHGHAGSNPVTRSRQLRRVHSWESGSSCPDDFYKPVIAKTFGTVTAAIWPVGGSRNAAPRSPRKAS